MMWRFTTLPVLALCVLVACVKPSKVIGVSCATDADCITEGATGTCQATGFCSYPDPSCVGGQRYSPAAGDSLANTCLGGAIPCGAVGQACCTGSVCGADLECDASSMTCQCGRDGQVCCAGSMCSANLACAEDARCACGALGEPCCGGSTCDSGLSCDTGSCTATVLDVGTGLGHACALLSDRSVWCWGNDWRPWGVFPNHSTTYVGSGVPHRVEGLGDVAALGSSEYHVCARKLDGTVWCWGHNESGQLGDGTTSGRRAAQQVAGLTGVTMLEGGRLHSCAVGAFNGTQGVWCWGRGGQGNRDGMTGNADLGRLGNNDIVDKSTPVAVDLSAAASGGQTVRSLAVGSYTSCIVMSDNTVWCWGRGTSGQLGNGASLNAKVPVQVNLAGVTIPSGVTIDEVSCTDGNTFSGGHSTCMRLSDGNVYCWGSGSAVGDGTTTTRNAPSTPVTIAALGGDKVIELTSGYAAHCVRTMSGNIWCWGRNQGGVLGNGDSTEAAQNTPVQTLVSNAVHLDLAHRTGCAVDMQGQLLCWGNNYRGQILGGTPRVYTPIVVPL